MIFTVTGTRPLDYIIKSDLITLSSFWALMGKSHNEKERFLTVKISQLAWVSVVLMALFLTTGCGSSGGGQGAGSPAVTLNSITVTPSKPSIPAGLTEQFKAVGSYSDGTSKDITTSANWSSNVLTVATVNAGGLATAVGVGTSTITATLEAISADTVLTVSAAVLQDITVTPQDSKIPSGLTQQFTAIGHYSDGTSHDITSAVDWASGATAVAAVSNSGLVTGVGIGTSAIKATSGTISGDATLTVSAALLQSIAVTPENFTLPNGLTVQFTAIGHYSDGTNHNITSSVSWTSGTPTVSTLNGLGLAKSVGVGTSDIAATLGTTSGHTTLTVSAAVLETITVTPANPTIPKGLTQQFKATGNYSDGTHHDLTASVSWSSGTTTVATVDSNGSATAAGTGTAVIKATSGVVSGETKITVSEVSPISIAIVNAGFENPLLGDNRFTNNAIPGWTGTDSGATNNFGVFNPPTFFFPAEAPEGQNVAYIERGAIFQTLTDTLTPGDYTLTVRVGDSLIDPDSPFMVQLRAGSTVLAQTSTPGPANGTFTMVTVNYSAGVGDPLLGQALEIRFIDNLSDKSSEPYFDSVQLIFTPLR